MLSNLKNYALVVLLVLTCMFGWLSYSVSETNGVLKERIETLELDLQLAEEGMQRLKESYEETDEAIATVTQANDTLQTAQNNALAALCKRPNPTPQGDKNEPLKTLPSVPRDGRLDPELSRLLHDTYCQGNRNDLRCSAEVDDPAKSSK